MNQRELFLRHLAQTSDFPLGLEIDSADGVYLKDVSGKEYIDLIAGIAVSNLGHNYPNIKEAVKKQVDKHLHVMVYGEYIQSPQVEYATLIAQQLNDKLDCVYFVNSGSEATEGGLKLAKRYTGRQHIVSCKGAYHGSTHGALSVTGNDDFKKSAAPLLPNISFVEFNNTEDLSEITKETACFIIEPIQGEAGIILPKPGYLEAIRKRCSETGTLLIFDEAQTGFGRAGKMFALEHSGVQPDILLLAKSLGGGMPLGAFISSNEIMSALKTNPVLGHITTFGGHPVSCSAGLAMLRALINQPTLITNCNVKEEIIHSNIKHEAIVEIRGKGLMYALEFESTSFNQLVIENCIKNGVISDWFLFNDKSLRIAPPLTISDEELEKACKIIVRSIEESL